MDTFVQQLINGLTIGSIYALIALGYTMVYGILRLINFAHGDIYMVGAYAGFILATSMGFAENPSAFGFVVTLIGSMVIAAAIGMAIERFAYRPVRRFSKITTLITAIGMSLLIEYLFVFVFSGTPRSFPQLLPNDNITLFGNATISTSQILIFVVSILLMVLLQWIIYKTKIGKAMRAVSFNINSAKLMGINTDFVIAFTFALGSVKPAAIDRDRSESPHQLVEPGDSRRILHDLERHAADTGSRNPGEQTQPFRIDRGGAIVLVGCGACGREDRFESARHVLVHVPEQRPAPEPR